MKQLRRVYKIIVLMVILSVLSPAVLPIGGTPAAQAATVVKLNKNKLSLTVGKTYTLKVTGTKLQITWSSNNKAVATVSKSGKVTAVKAGKALITAKVGSRKYTCSVTVKAGNPYVTKAPFDAKEVTINDLKVVIPKDWTTQSMDQYGTGITAIYPSSADLNLGSSNLTVIINKTGVKAPAYSDVKDIVMDEINEDYILAELSTLGMETSISGLKYEDYKADIGTVLKISYKVKLLNGGIKADMKQTIYAAYIDNYSIIVTATDIGTELSPDITDAAEYLVNSIQAAK